jgi:hypothetical protein
VAIYLSTSHVLFSCSNYLIYSYVLYTLYIECQKKWLPRYNWNIFESGVKHHKTPNPILHMQYHSMYNVIMLFTSPWSGFELTTSVVIGTDCIGSCKSNYHMCDHGHDDPCKMGYFEEKLLFYTNFYLTTRIDRTQVLRT